jgi:hypothetical protein
MTDTSRMIPKDWIPPSHWPEGTDPDKADNMTRVPFTKSGKGHYFTLHGTELRDYPNIDIKVGPFRATTHEIGMAGWNMYFKQDFIWSSKCRLRFYPQKTDQQGISYYWHHPDKYTNREAIFYRLRTEVGRVTISEDSRLILSLDELLKKMTVSQILDHVNAARMKALGDYRPEEPIDITTPVMDLSMPMLSPLESLEEITPRDLDLLKIFQIDQIDDMAIQGILSGV